MIALDLLGLAHPKFFLKNVIPALPKKCAIGVFDDPFGPVLPKLRKLLETGKVAAVRIQAHWSTAHAIVPIRKLRKKLPAYENLAQEYPDVKIYVSHSCEYNEPKRSEVFARVEAIKALAPSCIPVNSVYRGAVLPDVITEHHGYVMVEPGEIASMDGTDITDINARQWKKMNKQALFAFGWRASFNLREKNKPAPPPSKRTKGPSLAEVQEVVTLLS